MNIDIVDPIKYMHTLNTGWEMKMLEWNLQTRLCTEQLMVQYLHDTNRKLTRTSLRKISNQNPTSSLVL